MSTVTYPPEWGQIKKLAADSDYRAVMEFANYQETDPDKIDPDEDPSFTYEYVIQSFAISALAKFSNDTVSQFLIKKFNEYEDEFQQCDVLEALAQHQTEVAQGFLEQLLKEGNLEFQEAIIDGLDESDSAVSGETLELFKKTAQDDEVDTGQKGKIQKIIARSDKQAAAEMIDKEFKVLSQAGILNVDQSGLLQDLTDAAISIGHQIDLTVLDQLLTNDGSEWNAMLVARLVNSYPVSEAKQKYIAGLQEDFSDYEGLMAELGMGFE